MKPTKRGSAKAAALRPQASSGHVAPSSKVIGSKMPAATARKRTAPRMTPGRSLTSVPTSGHKVASKPTSAGRSPLSALAAPFAFLGNVISRIPRPHLPGKVVAAAAGALVLVAVVAIVVVNSALFTATNVIVNGSEHIPQQTAQQLIKVPAGTTLLNVNESAIASSLESNPWVSGVTIEREFPDTLVITPTEWDVSAIAYITASDVAWAISSDNKWISPVSLTVTVDADGNIVSDSGSAAGSTLGSDAASGDAADGTDAASGDDATSEDQASGTETSGDDAAATDGDASGDTSDGTGDQGADTTDEGEVTNNPDGTQTLTGLAAAQALARRDGAVLFTDIASDVEPVSGQEVTSEVILAGLEYARGFSSDFIAQIKEISLTSEEAISADLDSGVEVSLGEPTDIALKERVVTRLLEQEQGVTYINVRTPDNYSFRSAPDS
ncbi:FtsQ-type POTRA domain-containing protein [Collinsella sp. An2]|uniref:cell division protein FtsQ/DivIB n=1 Tax=Collinsella sp. An2 TaxID=1965585 RepID=UPI001EF69EF6|nr:FtsQ-type POTRA domain-containing protein [Collinsella sp. An2]